MRDVVNRDWSRCTALFEPAADGSNSLSGVSATRHFLVLQLSEHVRSKLSFVRHAGDGQWVDETPPDAALAPAGETVSVSAIWPDDSDECWVSTSGFLHPSTLAKANAADGATLRERVKALPPRFDSTKLECSQHFATSNDGTRIPYFLLGPKDMPLDGTNPTLLDGYGGFEIALTPSYAGSVGVGWLERGGVKAIANIRGGGEYGPRWHQAALREHRHRAYEDFEAVASDLIARGVCVPARLGCIGGSNGGLLIGNMLTRQGRSLFGAAVCQVPLLDMRRYHTLLAGASWTEEYGDPDEPGKWEGHLRSISPYHRLRGPCFAGTTEGKGEGEGAVWAGCPRVLFTTSTKDDRVHPGHARKMVKALLDEIPATMGGGRGNVFYWENIEGGHGGAADNKQRAHMWALTYDFLWQALTGDREPQPDVKSATA